MHKYIDAHCHLQNAPIPTTAIDTAHRAGVVEFICNSGAPDDWNAILKLHDAHPSVHACIGVHPWHVSDVGPDWQTHMENILAAAPDIMVGEVGLDKHYPSVTTQVAVFNTQLDIACEFARVAHIHCVGAWDTLVHIFKTRTIRRMPPAIVLHAFSGPINIIEKLANEYNGYFSFSPMIMDVRHRRMRHALCHIPMDRILAESDSDNSSVIPDTVNTIAEIKSVASDKMADIIYQNTTVVMKQNGQITPNTNAGWGWGD